MLSCEYNSQHAYYFCSLGNKTLIFQLQKKKPHKDETKFVTIRICKGPFNTTFPCFYGLLECFVQNEIN